MLPIYKRFSNYAFISQLVKGNTFGGHPNQLK